MPIPDTIKPGELQLVGLDGNAFSVMGAVRDSLRRAGNSDEDIAEVLMEMQSSDYDHLLSVAMEVTREEHLPGVAYDYDLSHGGSE